MCIILWQRFKSEDFFDSVQANQERNQRRRDLDNDDEKYCAAKKAEITG